MLRLIWASLYKRVWVLATNFVPVSDFCLGFTPGRLPNPIKLLFEVKFEFHLRLVVSFDMSFNAIWVTFQLRLGSIWDGYELDLRYVVCWCWDSFVGIQFQMTFVQSERGHTTQTRTRWQKPCHGAPRRISKVVYGMVFLFQIYASDVPTVH